MKKFEPHKMQVRDSKHDKWKNRLVLGHDPSGKCTAVSSRSLSNYHVNKPFNVVQWLDSREIPPIPDSKFLTEEEATGWIIRNCHMIQIKEGASPWKHGLSFVGSIDPQTTLWRLINQYGDTEEPKMFTFEACYGKKP